MAVPCPYIRISQRYSPCQFSLTVKSFHLRALRATILGPSHLRITSQFDRRVIIAI